MFSYIRIGNHVRVTSQGVASGQANTRPPGHVMPYTPKFAFFFCPITPKSFLVPQSTTHDALLSCIAWVVFQNKVIPLSFCPSPSAHNIKGGSDFTAGRLSRGITKAPFCMPNSDWCFDTVFLWPYRCFSIALKKILSLSDQYKIFTSD